MARKIRVLIIDCEPNFVHSIREGLSDCFSMTFADNANDALRKARQNETDIIVLGYIKPPPTPFELHLKLRLDKNIKRVPLLVVDVRPEEHSRKGWTRQQGQQMEADDYISKPVTPEELKEIIERLVSEFAAKPDEASAYMENILQKIKRIEKTLYS